MADPVSALGPVASILQLVATAKSVIDLGRDAANAPKEQRELFLETARSMHTSHLLVLGAHRAQITKVIPPWANRKDVEHDVALEIRSVMEFVFVRTVNEALLAAFGKDTLGWRSDPLPLESRL
ncbi:hypothetical protein C8J57DRAFT_1468112 [Mycena rebaudengoi]|nr:hypothetical protein C8J57DRAFT_1468112 [Mycena rebaudengoi]